MTKKKTKVKKIVNKTEENTKIPLANYELSDFKHKTGFMYLENDLFEFMYHKCILSEQEKKYSIQEVREIDRISKAICDRFDKRAGRKSKEEVIEEKLKKLETLEKLFNGL